MSSTSKNFNKSKCWKNRTRVRWGYYFAVRKIGSTFYVVRRKGSAPVSPDFRNRGSATLWIKERWEDIMFEEIVLK